jgi:homoserine kinase
MLITVPATSANLGPGFDTLGISLNLRNQVKISQAKFNSVSLKGEGSKNPKLKENNMFVNIFNEFRDTITNEKQHFRFEFTSKIPLSRGLGSSSAVIISAIACAYAIENKPLSKQELLNLALKLESHPDNITPAVMGGFTVATTYDNKVNFIKKNMPSSLKAVLVIPNKPISTNLSRKSLPYKYFKSDAIFNISHSSMLTACILNEKWDMLRDASKDKIHQYYRMKQMPELFNVQKLALQNGALMSTLSGSGSTFFNLVFKDDAPQLVEKLKEKFRYFKIFSCNLDNNGIKIEY